VGAGRGQHQRHPAAGGPDTPPADRRARARHSPARWCTAATGRKAWTEAAAVAGGALGLCPAAASFLWRVFCAPVATANLFTVFRCVLLLSQVCDIHDAWVSEAVAAAKAACSDGSAPAVRELHLCAPGSGNTTPPNSGNGGEGGGANSIMLTDKGLMQLAAWPRLSSLVVSGMPGITLAGLKALVGGCPSLTQLHVRGCPAVSAAPPESVSKVSVGPGGRAVTLCVS
jgi:hypothetical protein